MLSDGGENDTVFETGQLDIALLPNCGFEDAKVLRNVAQGERMHLPNHFITFVLFSALFACGGGGSDNAGPAPPPLAGGGSSGGSDNNVSTPEACGAEAQIDFVEDIVDSWYLWYAETASVDKASFADAQSYLDARLKPLFDDGRDRGFSYLTTVTEDETGFTTGAYIGFGFRSRTTGSRLFVLDVFESGPGWSAGIRRGMELIAVDAGSGFETLEDLDARGATSTEIFGASEVGVSRTFRFVKGGEEFEISVSKEELAPPALVEAPLLIERTGLPPVGYMHLRQFIDAALDPEPGFSSLTDASQLLREAGVTDLIVDFRYNGGGLLRVADTLLDLLGGEVARGEPSFKIQANDQQSGYNNDRGNWAFFNQLVDSFSPLRIAFITSGSTASASELVINGLNPHIEVVLIGANTFGKQVGQGRWDMHESVDGLAREDCDIALRLTALEFVNGENQGGYHQIGLEGTGRFTLCRAEDDIFNAFGDPRETLLATALDWFGSGVCPQQGQSGRSVPLAKQSDGAATWLSTQYIPERIDENLR